MVVGFAALQSVQNLLMPDNTSWADQRKKGRKQQEQAGSDPHYDTAHPYLAPYG